MVNFEGTDIGETVRSPRKSKTIKGGCAAKIQAILMNSMEEQAVFMTAVMECMAQNIGHV